MLQPSSDVTSTYRSDVYTLVLALSEGRAEEACEPTNKVMLFPTPLPRRIKCLSLPS
jgi:hypothetical protein